MNFDFNLTNGQLTVAHGGKPVLKVLDLQINEPRHFSHTFTGEDLTISDGKATVCYRSGTFSLTFGFDDRTLSMSYTMDLNRDAKCFFDYAGVCADCGVILHIEYMPGFENYVADATSDSYYWQKPVFGSRQETIPYNTQAMLSQRGMEYAVFLALPDEQIRAEICRDGLSLTYGCGTVSSAAGTPLVLSVSDAPYEAVHATYAYCENHHLFPAPLRDKRTYPDVFDGFGWCTWNAFYHEVTADKIFSKLDEFREKGISLRWLLIDDGWSDCTPDYALRSYAEDREKFPEGLAGCIRRVKEEYGVQYVGVWHAFTAHWMGVKEGSELFRCQKDNLIRTPYGHYYPAWEYDKAFAFWDGWHSYLAAQGVDFVKVDNQGGYAQCLQTVAPSAGVLIEAQRALDDSVKKNFHNQMINCMGMDMENTLRRVSSPVCRNSDDFFPKHEDGFLHHVRQNAYNAIFTGEIQYCDFDMWWSKHESALPSAVLRAISGGPVYVSDEIGATDPAYILPLTDGDRILRCDDSARPTADCLFRGDNESRAPLKVFNRAGENFAVAAFGFAPGSPCTLTMADVPGMRGEYLAHDYFADSYFLFDADTEINFELQNLSCALFNFYPIRNGFARIGRKEKYMGCADRQTQEVSVSEITK